jgi:DNA mismatch endonuclease, patch repair protein
MDRLTPEQRSRNMSRVRGKNTGPERKVRSMLHRMGYRFRLHRKDLPGKPDVVLSKYKTVVFVHGCFWHRCPKCSAATLPKTRKAFWKKKLEGNADRDRRNVRDLKKMGWKVITVWECELKDEVKLNHKFPKRLSPAVKMS